MVLSRKKYRRVTDLYVCGTEVVFKDDTVLWMQALNPFERDEAAHDAQLARARISMALKQGDEREKVEAAMAIDGRQTTIEKIADSVAGNGLAKVVDEIANDPEWSERVEIMNRSEDLLASSDPAEGELITRINEQYLEEVLKRQRDEYDFQVTTLTALTDEELLEEYVDAWIDKRGAEVGRSEYQLVEVWYAARVCEGVQVDGVWDHSACESHTLRAFETKHEVRELPEEFYGLLIEALSTLNMSVRDARFSDRQGSSSDSSPLPSEAGESTPSTPTATPVGVPGT